MKEVITYIAWDDEEFTDKSACEAYEEYTRETIRQLEKSFTMYDKDNNPIEWKDETDIESWNNWFEDIFVYKVEIIELHQALNERVETYLRYNFGYEINQFKPGKYHYDWDAYEWVK